MSCSAFEVNDDQNDVDPGVELSFTMLETVSSVELSILHGLPPLAEFCANAISSSTEDDNNLYTTMLRDDNIYNMLTNLPQTSVEQPVYEQPIFEQPVSEQPAYEKPVSEQQDFRSSDHDRSSDSNPAGPSSKALVECNQSSDKPGPPVPRLDPNTKSGTLVIGADQLVATPNSSKSGGGETNEQASNPLPIQNPPEPMAEPNELEIDEAFQNVFSGFSQTSEKDLIVKLDADTLQTCLNNLRNFPLLICNNCLELYQHIPPFQVHIQTCCDPPRFELKQKMDQAAMDQLARSMWKEVFIKELKKQPAAQKFDEGFVHIELDQLWNIDPSPVMLKCREIFIRAAVCIVSRRWVSNAVANDLHRVMKINQTKKAKKRTKSESETDQPFAEASFSAVTKAEKPQSEPKKRRGRKAKSTPKKTETDIAVRSLVNELDEPNMSIRYHFTPETPVSDHGIDVTPRVTDNRIGTFTTPTSDSGIEFTPEMDSVIDRFVREEKTSDVDLIEEAGKDFENLDTASDEWENGNENDNTEEVLSENEYVVGKIRDRRLLFSVENGIPLDEDYEYLVSWEGFGDEEDTWEPYEHLKHCTLKLKEFHERLKSQALRNRRGKRI